MVDRQEEIMATKKAFHKVASFEKGLKEVMGSKYQRLSKEDKKVIHEMSECQKKGGPIGSAVIKDDEK